MGAVRVEYSHRRVQLDGFVVAFNCFLSEFVKFAPPAFRWKVMRHTRHSFFAMAALPLFFIASASIAADMVALSVMVCLLEMLLKNLTVVNQG